MRYMCLNYISQEIRNRMLGHGLRLDPREVQAGQVGGISKRAHNFIK